MVLVRLSNLLSPNTAPCIHPTRLYPCLTLILSSPPPPPTGPPRCCCGRLPYNTKSLLSVFLISLLLISNHGQVSSISHTRHCKNCFKSPIVGDSYSIGLSSVILLWVSLACSERWDPNTGIFFCPSVGSDIYFCAPPAPLIPKSGRRARITKKKENQSRLH